MASRKQLQAAETAARACEERYEALVELTGAGVWITDLEGRTTSVDPRLRRQLGYRPDELLGRKRSEFIIQPEEGNLANNGSGGTGAEEEVELRCRNGRTIAVHLSSKPLRDRDGKVSGSLTLVAEAGGLKKAEAEVDLLKNEFFALISHELATPLTSMLAYLELITETQSKKMDEKGRGFLEVTTRNTTRLSRLLDDLMLLTQFEAGTFVIKCDHVNLRALAERAIDEARPLTDEAGIEVTLLSGKAVGCWADGDRVSRVIHNLILNAAKFAPPGSHVEVAISEADEDAVIKVADDGPGIPAAEHSHMFDRFYRGSGARASHVQGLGLGLAISRAIVDAHRGRLGLESADHGTTLTVELPRSRPEPGSKRWIETSAVRKSRRAAV